MLTDELLWDYADGFLEGEEKLRVDAYLRQHPAQQTRLEAILAEKRAFSALPLETPKAGFAQQVMAVWAAERALAPTVLPAKAKGRDWVLWGIAAAFGLMLAVPILLLPSAAPYMPQWEIPAEYVPQLPMLDWAGLFSSALLRIAALLALAYGGLRILDKYLQVRTALHVAAR